MLYSNQATNVRITVRGYHEIDHGFQKNKNPVVLFTVKGMVLVIDHVVADPSGSIETLLQSAEVA